MILLRFRFCLALISHISKKRSAGYSLHRPYFAQMSNVLVGWNIGELEKQHTINSGPSGNSRGTSFGGVVCYYYHKPGHVI